MTQRRGKEKEGERERACRMEIDEGSKVAGMGTPDRTRPVTCAPPVGNLRPTRPGQPAGALVRSIQRESESN